jgi:hypothetical protein
MIFAAGRYTMTAPENKSALIEAMNTGRAEWEALLNQIPDSALREPGVDGIWSVRDILAHICAYEQYMAAMLQDMKDPEAHATPMLDSYYQMQLTMYRSRQPNIPEQLQDVRGDQVNEVFAAAYHFKTPAEVRRMEAEAYQKLLHWINQFSEAELAGPFANTGRTLLQVLPRQSYAHYEQHIPAIRAWWQKKRAG